jgi:hypothetical protein
VRIDTHAPTTSASTLPAWSNSDVTLLLSATDNLSGVAATHYIVDNGTEQSGNAVLLTDEGIHAVQFWSVDNADNVEATNTVTVKIDKSAPSITSAQSPDANGAGWNNSPVTVTFTCGDSLSGVASCTGPQHVSNDGAGQVVTGSALDNAGNSASASRTVNLDRTPPSISPTVPSANANGWYNAPVTVTWNCADALSGVASCPNPTTFTNDGGGQSVTGTASDLAGNSAQATASGINLDQIAPTITASVVPAPNLNGWNSGGVFVHFTCTDATSGIAPGVCPADVNVSTEGTTTVTRSVADRAGNSAAASATVNIDSVAPHITGAQTPAPNGAGWNNTDVTVSFNCTDAGSGIATAGCTSPVTLHEGGGQSVTGTAVDLAGNTATTTVAPVNVDETPPTLSGTPTTAANDNGWYNAPVTIHWTCGDALSGVAGTCPADSLVGGEGVSLSGSASVSDVAGNSTTATSAPVNIDTTPPATVASSAPDWTNSSVTMSLSATDTLSGVAATYYSVDGGPTQTGTSVVLTTEGIHGVAFWSVDKAGNVESQHTATVKIDLSAPSITVSQSPAANGNGWNNTDVAVTFTCADSLSGVASCTAPQTVSNEGAGQVVSGNAVDHADNTASASHTVNLDRTPPSISPTVPPANVNGWYNAPVAVGWTCTDNLSGVATCPAPTTLSNDGAAQSVSGTAVDAADNPRTATASGINIDQTAPTLTASAPPTASGWYTGPVTVHWTCGDNLSGVTACPPDSVVSAEGFTTVAQTITDQAGNATTTDITIRIDKTPPTITGTATPAPNSNGWNNTDVNVSFACHDTLSGVASCTNPTTLHEGANQSVTGTSSDIAGNTASATVSGVNVDETPPTLSGAPTTSPNGAGWYNGAVTVHWTCGDALSGVDTATCPPNSSITSEGANQQLTRTVLDLAGNATTASSSPVSVDVTKPVTTASAVPSSFTNTNVSVTLSATDNLSGVAQTYFSIDGSPNTAGATATITSDGVHTLTYFSVDNAGNVEDPHVATVRIDKTAPTITAAKSPVANGAGWNNTNVTVTFTCGDSLSGIASCTSPQTVATQGAGISVTGTALDNAGNSAVAVATMSIDKTPPVITGSLSGTPNANGWFNAPVAAAFACSDTPSGIASCAGGRTFNEGANQSATGTATDIAGNTSSTTVGPVNVDLTKPTITAAPDRAPDNGTVYTGPVTIHFTCADALSGIAPGGCPADVVVSSDGTTSISGSVTDRAGNTASTSATITLTIASVRLQKQTALTAISAAQAAAGSQPESNQLKIARDALAASIDPSLWATGNHLQVHGGVRVFELEHLATIHLVNALQMPGHRVTASAVNGWIATFTSVDRTLATTAIGDAVAGNGNAGSIASAQAAVANGDALAAAGDNAGAIYAYRDGWKLGELALGFHCDGGTEPGD